MSGDKLFGGMHNANGTAGDLVCLFELVENGPFMEKQVPEEGPDGFTKSRMGQLIDSGQATRISVKGREGFIAATEKGMQAYLSLFETNSFEEAKRTRIATYRTSA